VEKHISDYTTNSRRWVDAGKHGSRSVART